MNLSQINENIIQIKNGQLTLPAKLREFFPWLNQDSLIEAKPTPQGLLLQPLKSVEDSEKKLITKQKNAAEILKEFAKNRKYDKNPEANLTEFVIQDRHNH